MSPWTVPLSSRIALASDTPAAPLPTCTPGSDAGLNRNAFTASRWGEERSNSFYVVAVNTDDQRSLDGFNGNHQAVILVLGNQGSFQPVKAATADSNLLPDFEEGILSTGNLVGEEEPHVLDLLPRNRNRDAVKHHESGYPYGLEDSQPTSRRIREAHKTVAGKQRHLN